MRIPRPFLLVAVLFIIPVPSPADEQDPDEFPAADEVGGLMDEFALLEEELSDDEIVSASKHRQSIFWSPAAVTVFTREDILASGAFSLSDLLRRVPGFDVYSMKSAYTLVGARALTDQHNNLVLLLVDGREELVELAGFAFWEGLGFDLEEVERVEVVRGPGSALYGANAVAAVVSVTTLADRPEGKGNLTLTQVEQRLSHTSLRLRDYFDLAGGVLSYSIGLGHVQKRPASDRRKCDQSGFRTHNSIRYRYGKKLDLSLHAGGVFGNAVIYIFAGDLTSDNIRTPWAMAKADLALGESSRLKAQVYYNQHAGDLGFRAPIRAGGLWIADFPTLGWTSHTVDGQLHVEMPDLLGIDRLLLIAGSNLRYSTLAGEGFLLQDDDELRGAVFAHLQWEPLPMLQLVAGTRLDLNDLTGTSVSPRAALVFRPWRQQSFRVGYGLAFRKPSFFEFLIHLEVADYNPAFPEIVTILSEQVGNPELENMKLHSFEAGWQGRFFDDRLNLSVDLFFNLYRDTISSVGRVPLRLGFPDLNNAYVGFVNGNNDGDAFGGEAQVSWRPSGDWTFWCNLGLRKVDYLTLPDDSGYEPIIRINLGVRYLPASGLFADLALHYVSRYRTYMPNPEDLLTIESQSPFLGDSTLMIARLGYRISVGDKSSLEAGLTVRTPLGNPFREFMGVPMPPDLQKESAADFGGELLVRQVAGYLRGWF